MGMKIESARVCYCQIMICGWDIASEKVSRRCKTKILSGLRNKVMHGSVSLPAMKSLI